MKNSILFLTGTICGLLIHSIGFSQTQAQKAVIQSETNTAYLNQLATELNATAIQEKAAAEQWSLDNGFPIKGSLPNGSFFEIQKLYNNTRMPVYYITKVSEQNYSNKSCCLFV